MGSDAAVSMVGAIGAPAGHLGLGCAGLRPHPVACFVRVAQTPPCQILSLANPAQQRDHIPMFSIEHEFDATVVTLVDEGDAPLQEDVVVNGFEECITVSQFDPRTDKTQTITLSISQMRDLAAALSLPEGVYTRVKDQSE